eukprot:4998114-Pleurochrysis_carterae.AAC.2
MTYVTGFLSESGRTATSKACTAPPCPGPAGAQSAAILRRSIRSGHVLAGLKLSCLLINS